MSRLATVGWRLRPAARLLSASGGAAGAAAAQIASESSKMCAPAVDVGKGGAREEEIVTVGPQPHLLPDSSSYESAVQAWSTIGRPDLGWELIALNAAAGAAAVVATSGMFASCISGCMRAGDIATARTVYCNVYMDEEYPGAEILEVPCRRFLPTWKVLRNMMKVPSCHGCNECSTYDDSLLKK